MTGVLGNGQASLPSISLTRVSTSLHLCSVGSSRTVLMVFFKVFFGTRKHFFLIKLANYDWPGLLSVFSKSYFPTIT